MDYNVALKKIAKAIQERKCILFLGAGIHCPPPKGSEDLYPKKFRPPMGKELSRRLAKDCKIRDEYPKEDINNLQRVAQYIDLKENFNKNELNELLTIHLHKDREPSPLLRGLAALDFPLIVTTNYDRLLESAMMQERKEAIKTVYTKDKPIEEDVETPDPFNVKPNKTILFKVHGDLIVPDTDHPIKDDSIVITDEDYIEFIMRMRDPGKTNPIPDSILSVFTEWPVVIIGYRLLDYDFRLLIRILRYGKRRVPLGFTIDKDPDPLIKRLFIHKGIAHFLVEDSWRFVPDLYRKVKGKELPNYYNI
jgi:hypothetical protein